MDYTIKIHKLNRNVISKIERGCFRNNAAILNKYELIMECKILNIRRYTGLTCSQIRKEIAKKRKSLLINELLAGNTKLFFYDDILLLIIDFVDFSSNDEEIMRNRCEQIKWAKEMKKRQLYCKMTDDKNKLIKWFKHHQYDKIVKINELRACTKKELWELYLKESEKIFILSLPREDIFLSENIILEWFKLLYYKQCRKTFFQYKKKLFPKIDWIRCTFWNKYEELNEEFNDEIWSLL